MVPSTTIYTAPKITPVIVQVASSTPEWIEQRITHYAEFYGVSEITMNLIIQCESRGNIKAQNYNPPIEDSRGIVQINLLTHQDVSVEQAEDLEFSLDFLARNLKAGKGYMWKNCNK